MRINELQMANESSFRHLDVQVKLDVGWWPRLSSATWSQLHASTLHLELIFLHPVQKGGDRRMRHTESVVERVVPAFGVVGRSAAVVVVVRPQRGRKAAGNPSPVEVGDEGD